MAIKRFDDRSNPRDKRMTPASSVPAHGSRKGADAGGTSNPRANFSAKPSSKPAKGSGSDRRPTLDHYADADVDKGGED